MPEEHKSEVARLRERIELECQAIRRLFEEPAIVASHKMINARYKSLDTEREALVRQVGEEEAINIVVDIYQREVG